MLLISISIFDAASVDNCTKLLYTFFVRYIFIFICAVVVRSFVLFVKIAVDKKWPVVRY